MQLILQDKENVVPVDLVMPHDANPCLVFGENNLDEFLKSPNELPRRKQRGIERHSGLDTESRSVLDSGSAGMTTNAASRGE